MFTLGAIPRLRAATPIYSAFGALGLIAMLRYANVVDWHGSAAWILVTLLASMLVGGLYALGRVAKARTAVDRLLPGLAPALDAAGPYRWTGRGTSS